MTQFVGSSDIAYLLYSVLPLDALVRLARAHGRISYHLRRREREVVRGNLEGVVATVATEEDADALTRRFFEYAAGRALTLALAPRLDMKAFERLFPLEGLEHLDAALAEQRGVILLGSHVNSVSLFPATMELRARGYDVRVALPEEGDPWPPSRLRRRLDRSFGTRPLRELLAAFYAQFNIRPIVRLLAENVIVAQTGDGLHSAGFVDVEFLGRRLPFPTGMARIAQITGAVVVPIFEVGAPPDDLRVILEEPRTVPRDEDEPGALERHVAAYAKRLEHHLLQNLACWEHWRIENALDTIAGWRQKSLQERYAV